MNLEEVLAKIKQISDDLCYNEMQPFCESLDEIIRTTSPSENEQENEAGHLKNSYNDVQSKVENEIETTKETLAKNLELLQEKRKRVKRRREELETHKNELYAKKKRIERVEKDYKKYQQKQKSLHNLRDIIKTYKLLTCTNFAFKKGSTLGCILVDKITVHYFFLPQDTPNYYPYEHLDITAGSPSNFEVFVFNNTQVSQEDMTEKLWTLLQKVSKQDTLHKTEAD